MNRLICTLVTCFIATLSFSALSCEEKIPFTDAQVSELMGKIKTLNEGDISTILEFNRIMCAERRIVRDAARQAGRHSSVPAVRSMAMQSSLFEKDVINLTVIPREGMSDDEKEFMRNTPILSYKVEFVDNAKGCMSLRMEKECNPGFVLSVSGSEVDLRYYGHRAKLRLTEDGKLVGIWSDGDRRPKTAAVEIRLD